MKGTPVTEGDYLVTIGGQTETVRVLETYLFESPNKVTTLAAHWLTGGPRFPYSVRELVEMGAVFKPLK